MALAQDHHIHTLYSGHSGDDMTVEDIVRQAEKRGLRRIVILEHVPGHREMDAFRHGELTWANTAHLQAIRDEVAGLRATTPVRIVLGAEVDADPRRRDGTLSPADLTGVQMVMAATHLVPEAYVYPHLLESLPEERRRYFYSLWIVWALHVAANPSVQVLAHPGREMVELGAIPEFSGTCREDFEKLLQVCRKFDTAFDVNETFLASLSESQRAGYTDIVASARDMGVKLSLGSDAHQVGHVGKYRHIEELVENLGLGPEHYFHPDRSSR